MATYFYCPKPDLNVRTLATSVGAALVRHFDGMDLWFKREKVNLQPGDSIICWGATLPEFEGVRVLNSLMAPMNEYEILHKLRNELGMAAPSVRNKDNGGNIEWAKKGGYLIRSFNHDGGNDLLIGTKDPDYYLAKYVLTDEIRIHSFLGRAIRVGVKVPREGFRHLDSGEVWVPNCNLIHPSIKSWNGGWAIKYENIKSSSTQRTVAHNAVQGLGLGFATVDLARVEGTVIIIGVGYAPDLPDKVSLDIYSKHLQKWIAGEPVPSEIKPEKDDIL